MADGEEAAHGALGAGLCHRMPRWPVSPLAATARHVGRWSG